MLSAALLAAGIGLGFAPDIPDGLSAALFGASALVAVFALFANATQHGYYKAARDKKAKLERALKLDDLALTTTPGMGSLRTRLGRVQIFQTVMLAVLIATDCTGLVFAITPSSERSAGAEVQVAVSAEFGGGASRSARPLVLSRTDDGRQRVIARASIRPDRPAYLSVEPGTYQLSTLAPGICTTQLVVTDAPLQLARIRC